jgi:YD repeat-containing protein
MDVFSAIDMQVGYTYDALGRLTKTTYPATPTTYTYIEYDGLGRKKFESEQTADSSIVSTTIGKVFEYDAAGRLIQVTLPEPQTSSGHPIYHYVYDQFGNQVAQIDPLSRMTVFTYNELHQQTYKYQPFVVSGTLPTTAAEVYTALAAVSPQPDYEQRSYDTTYGRLESVTDYSK